ncbi:MAG: J domain-containing protein [Desulfobacterales bacterium]
MYLAQKRINKTLHYYIRQSVPAEQQQLKSQELVYLGINPSRFIIYPGGHAFYIHEIIGQQLEDAGVQVTQNDLEDIFWPFLKPEIKRALEPFRSRDKSKNRKKMTKEQETDLCAKIHIFDKRRLHYLKFGGMDQGYVGRMPGKLLRDLEDKSRDEIEQYFWKMEKRTLKNHELKAYVYVIFDLQRFFTSPLAKQYPESIGDAFLVDERFIQEICRLNHSQDFCTVESSGHSLNDYLVRYLIMYFDNDFIQGNISRDFFKDFVNRHKRFTGYPQKVTVGIKEASNIFEVSQQTLNTITKTELIRLYRRLAQKHHPDTGGEHDKFIRLTEAFHSVMRKRR